MKVNSSASGLAYLWETTPVLGMEALPIYGLGHNNEDYKLPGAPWCYDLTENSKMGQRRRRLKNNKEIKKDSEVGIKN